MNYKQISTVFLTAVFGISSPCLAYIGHPKAHNQTQAGGSLTAAERTDIARRVEADLQHKLQSLVDGLMGVGRSTVAVNMDVDVAHYLAYKKHYVQAQEKADSRARQKKAHHLIPSDALNTEVSDSRFFKRLAVTVHLPPGTRNEAKDRIRQVLEAASGADIPHGDNVVVE